VVRSKDIVPHTVTLLCIVGGRRGSAQGARLLLLQLHPVIPGHLRHHFSVLAFAFLFC
jgi:hypothetical protein